MLFISDSLEHKNIVKLKRGWKKDIIRQLLTKKKGYTAMLIWDKRDFKVERSIVIIFMQRNSISEK